MAACSVRPSRARLRRHTHLSVRRRRLHARWRGSTLPPRTHHPHAHTAECEGDMSVAPRRIQRGVALVIALALLVILGILGTAGMRMSIAELMMAGNEQFRHSAELAA